MLLAGDGSKQIVADELQPKAAQLFGLQLIDHLFGHFADLPVAIELIEIFGEFGLLLVHHHFLTHEGIQILAVLLLLFEEVRGELTLFRDEPVLGPLTVVQLHLQEAFIFLVVVPEEVIVDVRNESLVQESVTRLRVELVGIEL